MMSFQMFEHVTTAQLSWHVQTFVAISLLEFWWEWNKFPPHLNRDRKVVCDTGPGYNDLQFTISSRPPACMSHKTCFGCYNLQITKLNKSKNWLVTYEMNVVLWRTSLIHCSLMTSYGFLGQHRATAITCLGQYIYIYIYGTVKSIA